MLTVLTIILVLMAIGMTALILLQRGQGATAGAAFGSGASGTVFGARGASSFLTKATAFLAFCVFGIALAMAVMISRGIGLSDGEGLQITAPPPAADAAFDPNAPITLEIPDDTGDNATVTFTPEITNGDQAASDSDVPAVSDLPAAASETEDDVPSATDDN